MTSRDNGGLVTTAVKNVRSQKKLTPEDQNKAKKMASLLNESGRNWIPVFLKEIKVHDYELIYGEIALEAAKIAGLKVIHSIQIPPEQEDQILKEQQALE